MGAESTDEKKAVSETPVEERHLVGDATPFGVGISLTTLYSHRLPHLAEQIINTTFAVVSTTLKKIGGSHKAVGMFNNRKAIQRR
jgi:hypothetical protein